MRLFCSEGSSDLSQENLVKLGTWQGPVYENDVERNVDKVISVLEDCKHLNLDFLCFPECYISGYTAAAIQQASVDVNDVRLRKLVDYTSKLKTTIIVGISERTDAGIFNTQLVMRKGTILGAAHKTILTGYDSKHFVTDLQLPVFEVEGIKFGVVTCHSTSFVEPAQYLRWSGARLLFTPHFNKIRPDFFWEHREMVLNNQSALATLLKMVVVRSNVIVVDGDGDGLGAGDSAIWDMHGRQVVTCTPFVEGLAIATFKRQVFLEEHWINRSDVPIELCNMIATAASNYSR